MFVPDYPGLHLAVFRCVRLPTTRLCEQSEGSYRLAFVDHDFAIASKVEDVRIRSSIDLSVGPRLSVDYDGVKFWSAVVCLLI